MTRTRYTLALLSLILVAGCKGKSAKEAPPSQSAKVAESRAAKGGGHARFPSNEPLFLNPVLETRISKANILIFEGLVGLDAKLEPVPRLADKWEHSNEGKTLTFRLRKDVKWSDGTPFTSKDVAFTIDRVRTTKMRSLWRTYFTAVESIETPDDLTVVVHYSRVYAPALVSWTVGILPAHKYAEGEFGEAPANKDPIGTGPFKLTRWEQGSRMLLSRNENWWKGVPSLESIELVFGVDDHLSALVADKLDFTHLPEISQWASEAQLPEFIDKFEQTTAVESIFRVIAWNGTKKPFDNPAVRRGLAHALNRSRVVDDVLLGHGRLLSAPFFPNMYGADPAIAPRAFDLEAAKSLLDSAKLSELELELITLNSQKLPINQEMFAIFKRDLSTIGVNLKVTYMDPLEFERRLMQRDFDGAFFGWLRDIPDPDPSALLHSAQIEGGQNFAGYNNPKVDAWLEEAVGTRDRQERRNLYYKVHAQVFEDAPYTVLYAPLSHYAWTRDLQRVNPADLSAQTRFPGISRWTREAASITQSN